MKKIFSLLLASILVVSSCEKIDYVTEEDPNNFKDASADLIINQPLMANALVAEGELARTGCIWSGQFTGADRQYLSLNNYVTTAGDYDNIWGTLYADGIAQCRVIEKKAQEANLEVLEGIAMIVEANLATIAADLWGNVPFTEVGDVEKYPQPKYDNQADVYNAALALLDAAIAKVGAATGNSYGSETVGAATRSTMVWAEVANSLKARIYLHMGDYANALTSAANGISSPAGDWFFEHNGDSYPNNIEGSQNVYWDFCVWNRDGYMGAGDAYLVTLLQNRGDASRLYHYYLPPGWWNGDWYPNIWDMTPYGYPQSPIFDAGSDFPIITYYETQLIMAESELLANTDATAALGHLNNVRAYWDARMGGGYPAYTATDFADNASLLREILTEKYISCYGQIETFNDMRRTDNYIGIPLKAGSGATKIPERFLYPQSEINSNANVPDIISVFEPTPINASNYPGI